MSNSNYGETFSALMWIVTVVLFIVAGIISWSWVEPHSFGGFIGFLLIWGALSAVGRVLAMGIVALISKMS